MNSLSLIFLLHIFTGIHGKGNCKQHSGIEQMFSCFYRNYHYKSSCMDIIKMMIHSTMNKKITDDCLVKQSKRLCIDGNGNNSCNKTSCTVVLASVIDSLHNQRDQKVNEKDSQNCDDDTSSNTDDVNKSRNGKEKEKDKGKNKTESIFKVGAIVGISVGITGTIILVLVILAIIYVCRRRSKRKKRKKQRRQQSIDQRLQIEHYESGSFSTHMGGYNVISANKSLNTFEEQGKNYVLGPYITKYDKDLCNRKLPEIKRCSGADGDENVYFEIVDDKTISSRDMEGVYKNNIKEVTDKGSYLSDQTRYEIPLGSIHMKREKLTKQQAIDQRSEIASLESSPTSTNNGANTVLFVDKVLDTDEAQGEYFVLDPSITKHGKDMSSLAVLPEIKRFSVTQGDERVYNEINEDEIQPPTDMKGVRQKKIEVKVKCSYHGDQNMYEIPRSTKDTSEKQIRPQSVDQRTEIDLQNSPSGTNKGDKVIMSVNESLTTDEEQGEYFVLDPSVTKYDRDISNLVLPEVKRFSVAKGDENVYNEIDEGKVESSTDMQVDHQKQIEDNKDIAIYRTDHINHGTQLGFDNTTYHVASEVNDKIF